MNSIFVCTRLKIAKFFILKKSQKFLEARRLPPWVTPTLATPQRFYESI